MTDKEILLRLQTIFDNGGAKAAGKNLDELNAKTKQAGQGAKDTGKSLENIGKVSAELRNVGAALTVAFSGAFATILKGSQAYVQSAGTTEATSRKWLATNLQIEQSTQRIQRVYAEAMLPYQKAWGDTLDKVSDFAEKNPNLVKASVGIIGGGAALAAVVTGAATVSNVIQKIGTSPLGKFLFKGAGTAAAETPETVAAGTEAAGAAGGEAAGAGAAGAGITAGGAAISIAGGILAGFGVNELLSKTKWGQSQGLQATNKVATVGAYEVGKLFGGEKLGTQWATSVAQFTGAVHKTGNAAKEASPEIDATANEISAYISMMRQEQQAAMQRNIQLTRAYRDFNKQEAYATEDYQKQKARSVRDFNRQELYADQDYYRQRTIASRDFNIEIQRGEEDHQRQMKRAQQDYQFNLWDVLRSGDALSYMRSKRQFDISQSRAEEDYNIEVSRKNQDFARTLGDQQREYEISRTRRENDFQIQLKDQAVDFDIQRKRAKEQFAIQLSDMQVNYDMERTIRRQAFEDNLRDMTDGYTKERLLRQQFTAAMLADLNTAKNQMLAGKSLLGSGNLPTHAYGGYTNYGPAMLHDKEYVLNPQTTSALEQMTGGWLSQDNVMRAVRGSGKNGGSSQVVWNDHRSFSGELTQTMRDTINSDTERLLLEATNAIN
jgi:hypothetical protein